MRSSLSLAALFALLGLGVKAATFNITTPPPLKETPDELKKSVCLTECATSQEVEAIGCSLVTYVTNGKRGFKESEFCDCDCPCMFCPNGLGYFAFKGIQDFNWKRPDRQNDAQCSNNAITKRSKTVKRTDKKQCWSQTSPTMPPPSSGRSPWQFDEPNTPALPKQPSNTSQHNNTKLPPTTTFVPPTEPIPDPVTDICSCKIQCPGPSQVSQSTGCTVMPELRHYGDKCSCNCGCMQCPDGYRYSVPLGVGKFNYKDKSTKIQPLCYPGMENDIKPLSNVIDTPDSTGTPGKGGPSTNFAQVMGEPPNKRHKRRQHK